jgi:hypothetical protein
VANSEVDVRDFFLREAQRGLSSAREKIKK